MSVRNFRMVGGSPPVFFEFCCMGMMNIKALRYCTHVNIFFEGSVIFWGKSGVTYVGSVGCTECTFGSATFCINLYSY